MGITFPGSRTNIGRRGMSFSRAGSSRAGPWRTSPARALSSLGTTYNRDCHGEGEQGHQRPMVNVFHREGDVIRHFWGSELLYAPTEPGQDPRHVGTIEPLWNLYDLTPEGRGSDWEEQLTYG